MTRWPYLYRVCVEVTLLPLLLWMYQNKRRPHTLLRSVPFPLPRATFTAYSPFGLSKIRVGHRLGEVGSEMEGANSIRSLPSVRSPASVFGKMSAKVSMDPEFTELRLTTARSPPAPVPPDSLGNQIRPDMQDMEVQELIKQAVVLKEEKRKVGPASAGTIVLLCQRLGSWRYPVSAPLQGPCDQRLCCCFTFCGAWVLILSIALSALWYYYLQQPNESLRQSINNLANTFNTGLEVCMCYACTRFRACIVRKGLGSRKWQPVSVRFSVSHHSLPVWPPLPVSFSTPGMRLSASHQCLCGWSVPLCRSTKLW